MAEKDTTAATPTNNMFVDFLNEAARYFEKRPTGGEDAAHWSNVRNATNCRAAAKALATGLRRIAALEAENKRLREALTRLSEIYPEWASERIALVRGIAGEALETEEASHDK